MMLKYFEIVNPCSNSNGDCDPLKTCTTDRLGEITCGPCPPTHYDVSGECIGMP